MRGLGLHRLTIPPNVESLAALAAQFLLLHSLDQYVGYTPLQCACEYPADVERDVQTDHIRQFDRSHGHAERLAGAVDDGGRDAAFQGKQGFVYIRSQNAVDHEAGRALARQRQLVELARELQRVLHGLRLRAGAPDDFHQLQLSDGIEEMDADQAAGILESFAQGLDLDARGIGGEDCVRFELGLELCVQRSLGVCVLEDRLDDHVRIADAVAIHVHFQAGERRGRRCRVLQALVEEGLGAVHGRLNQFRGAILQADRHAAKRRPGGDIAAHDAGADDVHMAEFRGRFSAEALQPVLQQEYAHEIARRGSAHEIADGSCLSLIALGAGRAVTLPQIENGVGRRILIASHAVPQRRGGLPGDERACRPQVQELIHEGCRRLRRRTQQPCLGALEKLGRRHEFIDQSRGQCPRALVGFAFEHQIERRTHADEPHRAHRAAETGMDAEQHLG